MNDSEKLKQIRSELRIKQGDFAKRISTTQGHISDIENGRKGISPRTAKLICSEFNISEEWFRTGNGSMFDQQPISLDEFAKKNDLSEVEVELIKVAMSIPKEERAKIIAQMKEILMRFDEDGEIAITKQPEQSYNPYEDEDVQNLIREKQLEKSTESSVSQNTGSKENLKKKTS